MKKYFDSREIVKTLLIVSIAVFIFAIFWGFRIRNNADNFQQRKVVDEETKTINIQQTIEYPADTKEEDDVRSIKIQKGSTALNLLGETVDYKSEGENENAYIISINGIAADQEKNQFWAFYINGAQAEVGAGSYILKEGDEVLWKVETY